MPPATVEAFVQGGSTRFPHPMMIFANVRKGFSPILNATVTATIEPETEDPVTLKLFDDGAGNGECDVIFHVLKSSCDAAVLRLSLSFKFFQNKFFFSSNLMRFSDAHGITDMLSSYGLHLHKVRKYELGERVSMRLLRGAVCEQNGERKLFDT